MKVCPSQRELMKKMTLELLPGRMSWNQHPVVLVPSYWFSHKVMAMVPRKCLSLHFRAFSWLLC